MRKLARAAAIYSPATTPRAQFTDTSDNHPPSNAPNRIATMVEPSIKPLAFTNLSGVTSSLRMPYFAGE